MYQHPKADPLRVATVVTPIVISDNQTIASGNPTSADGVVIVQGGDYQISAQATTWGAGATLTLKALGPKRTTWRVFTGAGVAFAADGDAVAGIPDGATIRGEVTGGTITGLTLVLSRIPA